MVRLIGIVPPEFASRKDLTFEDMRPRFEKLLILTRSERELVFDVLCPSSSI
jgi:hypothetical protein